jgi:tRNA pseudouridine65 synthase
MLWREARRLRVAIDPHEEPARDRADDAVVSPASRALSNGLHLRPERACRGCGAAPTATTRPMRAPLPPPAPLAVLYDVDDIVIVDKPGGVLVHNSAWAGPKEHTLTDTVRAAFPDAVPLHRLDRQTSGCVWFARNKAAAATSTARFLRHPKIYLALVRGHVKDAVDVDYALDDDDDPGSERKPAQSRIEPLARSAVERCSLVQVTLFTGRKHQARRHLKHLSHPILGDANHGHGPLNRDYRARYGLPRMALHCARTLVGAVDVDVSGAVDAAAVAVTAPWPQDLRAVTDTLFADVHVSVRGDAPLDPPQA